MKACWSSLVVKIFGGVKEKKRQFIMWEVACERQTRVTEDLILLASALVRFATDSQLMPGHLHR